VIERFSRLGDYGAIWYAIGAAGAVVDEARRPLWLRAVARVAIAFGVNQVVKVLVGRPRPDDKPAPTVSNLSFPSAHTTTSFCGARMYARLGLPLYPLAFALAASRLVLRVHHPSDVVAGAALGTVLAR
jgi:membrane-associated phospholipid phosphatase